MGALERARHLSPSAKLWLTALLVAAVAVPGSFALDAVSAGNHVSTFSATALYWPSGLAAAPNGGNQTTVTWTEPVNKGNGNGYAIFGYHYGTAAGACATTISSYTFITAVATGTTSYTDTSPYGGGDGTYWGQYTCYLIQTWYVPGNPAPGSPAWTATSTGWAAQGTATITANAIQIGFVATTVTLGNGNGALASGDTIAISYNQTASSQPSSPALTSLRLCSEHLLQTFFIAQTAFSTCDTTGGTSVGTLSGGSFNSNKDGVFAITAASFTGNTLNLTIGGLQGGKAPSGITGTWTFTPSTSVSGTQAGNPLIKTVANPSVPCAAGAPCLPTTTTGF